MKGPIYSDLGNQTEDERITIIGRTVMERQAVVGFIVEDEPHKAERYINKLKERFPGIVVMKRFKGPTRGVQTVKMGPPVAQN